MKKAGPDSGWSWVIAFSCFSIYLILFGIYRTSGVLLVTFINEYTVSREESSWPFFLCFSVVDLTGLIVGPIGQKFGIRKTTITGALISAIGFSLCYFAHSLIYITVCFGVIFGLGYGMAYTLIPVIINEYFLKHRSSANGIAQSGSCFGSVIFPPLYEHLLNTYGLNGSLLLIGGIILQLVIAGALMRPPSWLKSRKITLSHIRKDKGSVTLKDDVISLQPRSSRDLCILENEMKEPTISDKCEVDQIESLNNSCNCSKLASSEAEFHSDECEKRKIFIVYKPNISDITNNCGSDYRKLHKDEVIINDTECSSEKLFKSTGQSVESELERKNIEKTLSTKDELCLSNDPEVTLNKGYEDKYKLKEISSNSLCKSKQAKEIFFHNTPKNYEKDTEDILESQIRNVSIIKSFKRVLTCPMFYVIAFSNITFFATEEVFYVINVDFFIDKAVVESDIKYIIITFSIFDLTGRLCFGWVTDRGYLSRSRFLILCLLAVSAVFFCFPMGKGFVYLMILNSIYGLILGAACIMFSVLPAEYLDEDVQEVAFGMIGFLCGILTLLRTFIIGYFRDYLGSYNIMFYMMGAINVITAAMWLLENCILKWTNRPKLGSHSNIEK